MLQIAICDDEKFYRDRIQTLLAGYLEKRQLEYTITRFFSGEDFLSRGKILYNMTLFFWTLV